MFTVASISNFKEIMLNMVRLKRVIVFVSLLFGAVIADAQVRVGDTVLYARDSVIELEPDPTTIFFQQGEKTKTPGKVILVTKSRKTISLANFLKSMVADVADSPLYTDHAFADMDNDGKKELLISNFTGGAHCCDEIYIFKNIGTNKYQHVAKLFAGNTIITKEKEFIYDFHEQLGYFFTCFACGYTDTTDGAPVEISSILLRYNKGRITVVPGDQELKSIINDNLGKLGEQPYEELDDDLAHDDGLRKEIVLNLAVYYYSYGKNLVETQRLFNKYYKHPDAKKIWTAFAKQLQQIRSDNDF